VLSDDPTANELAGALPNLLSGQIFGAGTIQSLSQLGVTFNDDGSLSFDSSQLQSAYSSSPSDVQQFFTQKTSGMAVQLDNLIQNFAGQTDSVLSSRISSISDMMSQNTSQISSMNTMLSQQRQNLYNQFYQMEVALSQMQNSMSIVDSLSMVNSDGSSTNVFGDDVTNSLDNLSNLASAIAGGASTQAANAENNLSSSTSTTSSSTSSS
jgi:flagellar hook-associated protein 2